MIENIEHMKIVYNFIFGKDADSEEELEYLYKVWEKRGEKDKRLVYLIASKGYHCIELREMFPNFTIKQIHYRARKFIKYLSEYGNKPYAYLGIDDELWRKLVNLNLLTITSIIESDYGYLSNNRALSSKNIKNIIECMRKIGYEEWAEEILAKMSLAVREYKINPKDMEFNKSYKDFVFAERIYKLVFDSEDTKDLNLRGFSEVIDSLDELDRIALIGIYRDNLGIRGIGDKLGVSYETIRNRNNKTILKFKTKDIMSKLSTAHLEKKNKELKAKLSECTNELIGLREENGKLKAYIGKNTDESIVSDKIPLITLVKDLGFSNRLNNALNNEGIKVLKNIVEMNEKEVLKLKNVGHKSRIELLDRMEKIGYGDWVKSLCLHSQRA